MSRPQTLLGAAVAAFAAASLWLSLGIVAVTGADTHARIIAFPPVWLLAAFVAMAAAAVFVTSPSPRTLLPLALTALVWLPFVPGRVPTFFLVWQGPVEGGLWVLVVLLMVARRWRLPQPFSQPSTAPWIAAFLAASAYVGGAVALRDQLPIGDEPHYLMMTQSLIKDGDLRIENNHKNRDYLPFYKFDIPPHYLTRGTDGEIYSVHAPGVSVFVLPGFAFFGYYGGVLTVIACVALGAGLAWHAAWLLTEQAVAAWMAWASVFLTAPVFLQAITVFPDAVGAVPVVAALWLAVALDTRRQVGRWSVLAVSAGLAALPWLHSRFAILAGGLGLMLWARLFTTQGWRRSVAFLMLPAVAGVLWLGFFWWIWGTPSPTAPWGTGLTSRIEWIPRGVMGLLFDPQAGIFVPAPAYLLAVLGWPVLLRSRPRLAIETLVIGVGLLLSVASYEAWWGGQGAPGRYVVAALPLALPAIAAAATVGRVRMLAYPLAVTSVLLLSAKVGAAHGAFAFNPERGVNPLLGWIAPNVDMSAWAPQPGSAQVAFVREWRPWLSFMRPTPMPPINISLTPAVPSVKGSARLGDARVFFLDDAAYPEPTGFWLQAEREATLIADLDDPARNLGLRLQAGPVATTAEVTINGETQFVALAPRERHELVLPPAVIGAWNLQIRVGAGFRPDEHDPQARDHRNLGIWVELF